jgi:aspartyl-tRNA(Asn)/glutamyl-tRNA(Gln) amidotransferase subunit C
MSLSDAELQRLADLARLHLDDAERDALRGDIGKLLDYVRSLQGLETSGVEELVRPVDLFSVFRDDEARPGLTQAEALELATQTEDGFFKVPRTVEP